MYSRLKTIKASAGAVISLAGLAAVIIGLSNYTITDRINAQDPMFALFAVGLVSLLIGMLMLMSALLLKPVIRSSSDNIKLLAQAALFAALSYIGFQFFRIDLPVGTEKTAFHLGNTFVVLAALLLGGSWGGMAGAVGMTLADLTSGYATSAPKTFLLKLCIGLIAGFFAHRVFKIEKTSSRKHIVTATLVSGCCAMGFNIVADPVVGYFYKRYLFGIPQDMASALAKMSALTTLVNAVLSVICTTVIFLALRPALIKSGLYGLHGRGE